MAATYISTRGESPEVSFSEAFAAGLAPDGGLYLPKELPSLPENWLLDWQEFNYPQLAHAFFSLFDEDHSSQELMALMEKSYSNFSHPDWAPTVELKEGLRVLELFHGPTLAFKDFGLQLLGNLFADQIQRSGKSIHVLGATSGDTGSAAIHGLAGKEGVRVFILYPEGRISALQERQMTCTGADNIYPIPIEGSFDDAQKIVKTLLADAEFKSQYGLSAINSINLARILAQSVYYLWSFLRLDSTAREKLQYVVPTGNFGNIFAGWLTAEMGLPVERFVIATNQNDILYRLFTTGQYQPGSVSPSLAPSMDIQVASNFERLFYMSTGGDSQKVRESMKLLQEEGRLSLDKFDANRFRATRCRDQEIQAIIERVYKDYDYVLDPHTACAFADLEEGSNSTILATAHPAKFPETITKATGQEPLHDSLEKLKSLPLKKFPLSNEVAAVKEFISQNASF